MNASQLIIIGLLLFVPATLAQARRYEKDDVLRLREYVSREWTNELIHYSLEFSPGDYPSHEVKLVSVDGRETPVQLSDIATYSDGSLQHATIWLVANLKPNEVKEWRLLPGQATADSDLKVNRREDTLEVTTKFTGARFHLGEKTFTPSIFADKVPPYITAIRHRSGNWGGRGWFETPHKCRRYKVWVMEEGPVYIKVGFEYVFDGFRGEGKDVYKGYVRIAAQQEFIEFVEEFSLADPNTYRIWKPKTRAEEIMWDWWAWRPHESQHNFCFSIYEPIEPTKARWFGHNSSVPEKRTGRNPGMDFETEYALDGVSFSSQNRFSDENKYSRDRFDISINAYLRGCPDQAKSYFAWRAEEPESDAIGIIGIRGVDWLHPDMVPHSSKAIVHHTDTADLRIYARFARWFTKRRKPQKPLNKPDLVVKAPLHLGRRAWGILTLKMPEAAPVENLTKNGAIEQYAFQAAPTQALKLQSKYGNRQLDKVKNWTLEWKTDKPFPSLFVKDGGLEDVRARIQSSQTLRQHADSQRHKAIMRYLLDGGEENAQASYDELMDWCRRHIDILFEHGYCSHRGLNNNQYPWWMQEMSARFDLIMGMPEIKEQQKETLKAYFSFCVHLLQDDEFMPPRTTGVGWGSINMPINTRGGRAVTAAVLSDNPDAEPWIERAIEYLDVMVRKIWDEDGSPVSAPHYVSTSADPLMNMALPLYYAGKIEPIQGKYPRLKAFTRHLIDRLTPPDIRAGNMRILPTFGHTRIETGDNIGKYAMLMALTDNSPFEKGGKGGLAGEAIWMWQRAGEGTSGFMDGIYYMSENIEPIQPELKSKVYPESLTFLRNGFPEANETYMAIHAGNHSIDHWDSDVGAFILYAKGVPLCLDFSSMYTPNCAQSLWHNTLSWNVEEHERQKPAYPRGDSRNFYTGKIWFDHQYAPHTLLERSENRVDGGGWEAYSGTVPIHTFFAEVDYVVAAIPMREFERKPFLNKDEGEPTPWAPFTEFDRIRLQRTYEWQRRFIFVKDADLNGPNYFLIQDELDGQDELTPQANIWCLADSQTIEGDRVFWKGQYNIDLDMYVAFPKNPVIATRTWWHDSSQPMPVDWKNGKEEQIAAHVKNQPGKGGFTMALYPLARDEIRPEYESNDDGTAVQITIGERRDVIFCSRQQRRTSFGGVTFEGTAAVVKQHPEYTTLTLLEPGELRVKELTLLSDAPISLRLTGDMLTGQAVGPGAVMVKLPKAFAGKTILINGKEAATVTDDGTVRLVLETGANTKLTLEGV